jgi:hypothetical protein
VLMPELIRLFWDAVSSALNVTATVQRGARIVLGWHVLHTEVRFTLIIDVLGGAMDNEG